MSGSDRNIILDRRYGLMFTEAIGLRINPDGSTSPLILWRYNLIKRYDSYNQAQLGLLEDEYDPLEGRLLATERP